MNGHLDAIGNGQWSGKMLVLVVSVIFGSLGTLFGVAIRHEGAISGEQAQLGEIHRTLERLESKVDELRGKK